ncbi:aquaporin [uncultured Tenacibaculum sp.]|uniref:MIP/aquaporin family protein n=1 Tax=uncultured Tenacibaculum sp. TaxID=174713 RepID=UPI002637BE63|nr:aquaporin [uncultured Tenacibaculum sp.]
MKKYISEFIGTFALVFCGTGAVVVNSLSNGSLGLLGISAVFGIMVAAMIYAFGSSSGAHINPAVTIGLFVGNLMPRKEAFRYVLAQIGGAILASGLLSIMFPGSNTLGETLPNGGIVPSMVLEMILTFFLMLTILSFSNNKEQAHLAGAIIGMLVVGIILIAGPISGGSFNPARSIAPALISGDLSGLWLYILAPITGSSLAIVLWNFLKT